MPASLKDRTIKIWLEFFPSEELASETSRMIVNDFREGITTFDEAAAYLKEYCMLDLDEWIRENRELNKQFDK